MREREVGTLQKKRYRNCEGKWEMFKEGVRRAGGWELEKRLRGSKWWSEREVSEGHVSDFLNVMRQHGGGCNYG